MPEPAVRIRGLSKQYQLGLRKRKYKTIREAIVDAARAPFRRLRELSGHTAPEGRFWALRDIDLEVAPGEVLGIIGHNGAGKSTLLKILSQITEPTTGEVRIRGRIGSLLEVGTGFHPELTGRENVFLNGAILGMSRAEVKRKFDDIVAFAGVEEFLDTPVKRFSSGMHVRLAFAVAAHLEPEILVIDEVLAVGDAEFQQKCLGKMGQVAAGGRTILFVSHNMAAVEALCTSAVMLEQGRLVARGTPEEIINRYQNAGVSELATDVDLRVHPGRSTSSTPVLQRLRLLDDDGNILIGIPVGGSATFEVSLASPSPLARCSLALSITGPRGERLMRMNSHNQMQSVLRVDGSTVIRCRLKNCRLLPGRYQLEIRLRAGKQTVDEVSTGLHFEVLARDVYGTGRMPGARGGQFLPEVDWAVDAAPALVAASQEWTP